MSLSPATSFTSSPASPAPVRRLVRCTMAFALVVVYAAAAGAETGPAPEIRVGLEAFLGPPASIAEADESFAAAAERLRPAAMKLAVGTEQDIITWATHGTIDAAVVAPRTFAAITAYAAANHEPTWEILAARSGGLPGTALPEAVLAASSTFAARDALASAVLQGPNGRFVSVADKTWLQRTLVKLRRPQGSGAEGPSRGHLTLADMGSLLTLHTCTQQSALRIALVFAGGGAKCSYQVGAVQAIEQILASLRARYHEAGYDIALVAGTSGGALNAVPVALGLSADPESGEDFAAIWQELDQRELIRPSRPVRVLMILWFVCIQGVLLLRYRHASHFKNPDRYPWIIGPLFVVLGAAQVAIARLPFKPWSVLGMSSTLHHFWLWLSWGLEGSGWTLIALAAVSQVVRRFPAIASSSFPLRYRVVRRIFWVGIVLIPLAQTINIFLFQSTLSDNLGIEGAIVRNFSALIDRDLARRHQPALAVEATESRPVLMKQMSRELIGRRMLKRDLVLTGSELPTSTSEAAGDLYFYARGAHDSGIPKFGSRGVSIDEHPEIFMDVLMGSGAIYPVFPARTLADFPAPGQSIELVDGSFEHRSPVESAVLWGATHILVVQAATDEVSQRGSFLDNLLAAVNHLYDQAQLLDFRSREHAVTLTLTPQPPHIGLLDFSDNLIRWSIDKGRREASAGLPGSALSAGPFHKELSEPVFWVPPMPRRAAPECRNLAL